MPRRPRLELPGMRLHVVQRGVNRASVFVDDDDRGHYLALLHDHFDRQHVSLHAYVLMGNHVHLLASADPSSAISCALRNLGQCSVQAFNRRHGRTGTLWEGRSKPSLVDTREYLLTVYRYFELNPVRAAMAAWPEDYRWSSHGCNAPGLDDPRISPHPAYAALGTTQVERLQAYQRLFDSGLSDCDTDALRLATCQQKRGEAKNSDCRSRRSPSANCRCGRGDAQRENWENVPDPFFPLSHSQPFARFKRKSSLGWALFYSIALPPLSALRLGFSGSL